MVVVVVVVLVVCVAWFFKVLSSAQKVRHQITQRLHFRSFVWKHVSVLKSCDSANEIELMLEKVTFLLFCEHHCRNSPNNLRDGTRENRENRADLAF